MKTETDERAARVRQIAEGHHGRVLDRDGDIMTIEVPADVSIGLNALWGGGGFPAQFVTSTTRLAPRRVTNAQGAGVVCPDDLVTTAFYTLEIDLKAKVPVERAKADRGF